MMTKPLVSIISFCKDRRASIGRSIESVLNQTYKNIEFVIQDGASTDGTLEIIKEYAARDSRIKLISEADTGPDEAFWRVLHRCSGEIMGTCLSDEELMPDAVAKAVEFFAADPELGAITGDGYVSDEFGRITGDFKTSEFNIVDYLFSRYCPFWPGSFFRTKALSDIGLSRPGWTMDCIEFEIWCRLGTEHVVKHVDYPFAKYAIHPGQLSNTPHNMRRHLAARLSVIEKLFSAGGFFGNNPGNKNLSMLNQISMFADHAQAYKFSAEQADFESKINNILSHSYFGASTTGIPPATLSSAVARANYFWALAAHHVNPGFRKRLSYETKNRLRGWFVSTVVRLALLRYKLSYRLRALATGLGEWKVETKRPRVYLDPVTLNRIHLETAAIYESRGQIRQALDMWHAAEPLRDAAAEALACQAYLKLPSATEQGVMDTQHRWALRHAQPDKGKETYRFKAFGENRKIRIGYHCSFFDSDCIRAMMQGVVENRDRSRFAVYGYSPVPTAHDITEVYDGFRDTAFMKDSDFVDLVRSDGIDIFVELTGLSPGHRFSAMASRCAPIQVSYLNHTGTSAVPNVDYVFTDEICTPVGSDSYFTEKLYRLPGSFFCFDYDKLPAPPVSPPPSLARGYVTFGCFGSGGKLNDELVSYWAALLKRIPNSILYLKNTQLGSSENRRFMIDRFNRFDIGAERLRIEGGTDRQSVLKCYADVDVTLDTWPYCGGNTIGESFWQGVPVVTLYGSRFSSRYGASLVTAAGCSDLIGRSPEEYVSIAAALAEDTNKLTALRMNLRQMYKRYGLGDSIRLARAFESAFSDMIEHYQSSQPGRVH